MLADSARDMRGLPAHPDLAITDRHRRRCGAVLTSDAVRDAEHRHDAAFAERHRWWEGCQTGGDPSLFGSDKPQAMAGRHARGQDELDPALDRIDAQRDAPRPRA